MKVLITGAAGYVGRFLSWKLEGKHDLRLTDIIEPDPSRIPWVYEALGVERTPEFTPTPSNSLEFTTGDLCDEEFCKKMVDGVDAVIHLAGNVKHEDIVNCFTGNATATLALVNAAADAGVKRFLAASSINAAGLFHCRVTDRPREWAYLPVDEAIPVDHEDAYSVSKFAGELICDAWTRRTGITTASFRFSGVFPPEWTESYDKVVQPTTAWIETLAEYVDLRDVVGGLIQALECETLPSMGVYHLTAADTMYPEPTMEIIEKFRPDLLKVLKHELPGRTALLSHERARQAFGFAPKHCWRPVL